MLLTIDAGNTNVVFGVYDGLVQKGIWRISTDVHRTADEYAVWLFSLMALKECAPKDITGAIIASVVPGLTFHLRRLCRDHCSREPLVIGDPGVQLGINVRLDNPKTAGADRLVNAMAAVKDFGGSCLVVDLGTATTFDVVNADKDFCGGVIAPGFQSSAEVLHRAAAQLPRIEIVQPDKVIGTSTIPAMQSGIFWGYVGLVEGLVGRIKTEYGAPLKVIGTGGLSPLLSKVTDIFQHIDLDLTLRGLCYIHALNNGKLS